MKNKKKKVILLLLGDVIFYARFLKKENGNSKDFLMSD